MISGTATTEGPRGGKLSGSLDLNDGGDRGGVGVAETRIEALPNQVLDLNQGEVR